MEPITSPSPSHTSSRGLWIAGGVVLAFLLVLVGSQMLRTDIIRTGSGTTVELSTDKLLYRTSSGATVPVTVSVKGVSTAKMLVGIKLTLDGIPANVTVNEKAITGTGSTIIDNASVQRHGGRLIVLLSGMEVKADGAFVTIPFTVTADFSDDNARVVSLWSDPTAGSQLISQIAIDENGEYQSYPLENAPFFRLSQGPSFTPTPTATSTPTPPAYCAAEGEFCAVHLPCCSGQCGTGTGTTLTMVCGPTSTPTPTATGSGTTITPTPTGSGTVITPTPSPSPSPTTAPIQCSLPLRGDVNCDARITIADLVLLVDFLAGKAALSASQLNNANVAEMAEGRVNLADATAFAKFISAQSPTL